MLKNLIVFALYFVAINASGQLHILNSPHSLGFKGDAVLRSESLGDVLSASLGYCVDDDATDWPGMYINDVFSTPKTAVCFLIKGIDSINVNTKVKTYSIAGSASEESLNALSSEFESSNIPVATFDLNQFSECMDTFADTFNDTSLQLAPTKSTNNLKPDLHSEDKDFLTQVAFIDVLTAKYRKMAKPPTMMNILINMEPMARAHGYHSTAMNEALKMIEKRIEKLTTAVKESSKEDCLLVAVAEKAELNRSKREAVDGNAVKELNLATYYNEDYPVIFNIILWFMVVLAFSLLAICYAIGSMDPGRDSIIYRMTSTRMKKDN